MTIEDMVDALTGIPLQLDSRTRMQIVQALQVGQRMREKLTLDYSKDFHGMIDAIGFFEACRDWDRLLEKKENYEHR